MLPAICPPAIRHGFIPHARHSRVQVLHNQHAAIHFSPLPSVMVLFLMPAIPAFKFCKNNIMQAICPPALRHGFVPHANDSCVQVLHNQHAASHLSPLPSVMVLFLMPAIPAFKFYIINMLPAICPPYPPSRIYSVYQTLLCQVLRNQNAANHLSHCPSSRFYLLGASGRFWVLPNALGQHRALRSWNAASEVVNLGGKRMNGILDNSS